MPKASFNLPERDLESLKEMAEARGITATQALRQAIANEQFIQQQIDEKNKLLIETPDNKTREIVFRH